MLTSGHKHAGAEETRARIIAAARDLFEQHGTRGTTTREVAERAGVNEATVFRHFGSKRALLDAMREQCSGAEELRSAIASLDGRDAAADLRALARYAVEHMRAKRAMMCISLAEEAAGTDDAPEWRGPSRTREALAAYFADHVRAGVFRGDPDFLARHFLGMLFSYVVARKIWEDYPADSGVVDTIVDTFLNGVSA